jgi:HEAT repeat protein
MKDGEVASLIQGLRDGGDRREAAIARLTIAGKRAVVRLVDAYRDTTDRDVQVAILRVLEAIGDERALGAAETAIAAHGDVAVAGIAVLRELMGRPQGGADVKALDRLLAIARDPSVDRRVRASAVSALGSAPADVRQAIGSLAASDSPLPASESLDDALWADALSGRLPDNPAVLRDAIPVHAPAAPLADLRRLIEALAAREQDEPRQAVAQHWLAVRGALHQALALRGSRIALYDLRETLDRSDAPLPSPFLGALQMIGDDSCLEPLAGAFSRAGTDARWQHQLGQAFHEIVKRERITKRHSALRRALAKAPELEG